jgi:hypothetical protein
MLQFAEIEPQSRLLWSNSTHSLGSIPFGTLGKTAQLTTGHPHAAWEHEWRGNMWFIWVLIVQKGIDAGYGNLYF